MKENETTIKQYLGHDIVTIAPIVFVMAGYNSSIRLNKYMSLDLSHDKKIIGFRYDF